MKKYFTLILLFVASMFAGFADNSESYDANKVMADVRIIHSNPNKTVERSLMTFVLDIWFDKSSKVVSLDLYNIGIASICIIDSTGDIINEVIVETDSPISVELSARLSKGSFSVIVRSDYIYAEGVVEQY